MATLSIEKIKRRRKRKWICSSIFLLLSFYIVPYISSRLIDYFENLIGVSQDYTQGYIKNYMEALSTEHPQKLCLTLVLMGFCLLAVFAFMTFRNNMVENRDMVKITDDIYIPKPVENGPLGNEWFASEEDKKKLYYEWTYNPETYDGEIKGMNLGVVVEGFIEEEQDRIRCVYEDVHTYLLAITRKGKGRRVLLETIFQRILTRKSFIAFDTKLEAFLYSKPIMEEEGCKYYLFDLYCPKQSDHYNFLYFVNEAVAENDTATAMDYIWDMVSILVEKTKGEPIWRDGTSCVLATAICLVSFEAPEQYKNLTNVYYFIRNMFKEDDYGEPYIEKYLKTLPKEHPAREPYGVVETAPLKTRGSFITQALTLLKDFTNPNIAEMTSRTDYDLRKVCEESTAVFIRVPDEKETLYKIANLYVMQAYIAFTKEARKNGGRVKNEVDIYWDEFGSYPYVPGLGSWFTVSAGRGIRFLLTVQDDQQVETKYKDEYKTIIGNCAVTVYLGSGQEKTLERLKKKLGSYTAEVQSASNSVSGEKNMSTSSSSTVNMQSRPLLYEAEIEKIKAPYGMVLYTGEKTSIVNLPDLAEYYANEEMGLGDKKHNQQVMMERENSIPKRKVGLPEYWNLEELLPKENDSGSEEAVEFIQYL